MADDYFGKGGGDPSDRDYDENRQLPQAQALEGSLQGFKENVANHSFDFAMSIGGGQIVSEAMWTLDHIAADTLRRGHADPAKYREYVAATKVIDYMINEFYKDQAHISSPTTINGSEVVSRSARETIAPFLAPEGYTFASNSQAIIALLPYASEETRKAYSGSMPWKYLPSTPLSPLDTADTGKSAQSYGKDLSFATKDVLREAITIIADAQHQRKVDAAVLQNAFAIVDQAFEKLQKETGNQTTFTTAKVGEALAAAGVTGVQERPHDPKLTVAEAERQLLPYVSQAAREKFNQSAAIS